MNYREQAHAARHMPGLPRGFARSVTQDLTNPRASPSGHLEDGESILSAAVRETKEETGIPLEPAALRQALSIHERHPGTTHARIGFAFEPASWHGEPVNAEPGKCSEFLWADPARLPSDTVGYTAAIINAVERGTTFALNGW
jgi:8-oxo-dGTP diphosphatase